MTYNTPELLLVGAAQNLVLGFSTNKVDSVCQTTNFDTPSAAHVYSGDIEDGATW